MLLDREEMQMVLTQMVLTQMQTASGGVLDAYVSDNRRNSYSLERRGHDFISCAAMKKPHRILTNQRSYIYILDKQ